MLAPTGALVRLPSLERTADLTGTILLPSVTCRVSVAELSQVCAALSVTQGHLCVGRWAGEVLITASKRQSHSRPGWSPYPQVTPRAKADSHTGTQAMPLQPGIRPSATSHAPRCSCTHQAHAPSQSCPATSACCCCCCQRLAGRLVFCPMLALAVAAAIVRDEAPATHADASRHQLSL